MPKLPRPYYGLYAPCENYIDLEPMQDDKTVLKNPHKGWYWHYIDNGYGRPAYRKDHPAGDYLEDFPGLNHLYLRFDWGDIEKEEGKYDWSYIDGIMDEWGAKGFRFSFRICTYECAASPDSILYATPKWVYDAGANKFELENGCIEPDYGDPVFLEKLENFMREYGRKFNNDPRVEFVDIGTFGTWGEGHTVWSTNKIHPEEVIRKHILLHAKYFPDKYILLNDDMIGHREVCPEEEKQRIMEYAKTLGCGARDDSVCVGMYCEKFGYDTLRSPRFFDQLAENAPVDIEFEHYHMVLQNPAAWRDGLPFIDALRRTRATYAGFHGYPRPWLEQFPALTEYVANRLGYWFFLEGLRITPLQSGCSNVIGVYFTNRGFSRCYQNYKCRIRLRSASSDKQLIYTFDTDSVDCRRWMPNETVCEQIRLDLRNTKPGTYLLELGLFENDTPILLGMQPEYYDSGWYRLTQIDVL